MKWTFNWRDEDPAALILLIIIMTLVFFTPWHSCDPTSELKYGPAPEVQAQEGGAHHAEH